MRAAERHETRRELQQIPSRVVEIPIEPTDLVVLTVRVIITALGASDFVATAQHRNALRDEHRRDEVPALPFAQRQDLRIVRRAFRPEIPRIVVVRAVAIVFAIRFVVFLVVTHEVV